MTKVPTEFAAPISVANHRLDQRSPLYLDQLTTRTLLAKQGPSLGLWRAAEIAALREQRFEPPVLDLGGGDGLVTAMVLPQVEIAVEPDVIAVKQALQQELYQHFFTCPIETAPIPESSIATVVSNSVLEHIPNLDAALTAVVRILKPGGKLIFTTPTAAFSQWLALPSRRYAHWRNQQLCHLNLWSSDRWQTKLEQVGLRVESVRPYLRREWVSLWDGLELLQQIRFGQQRAFGRIWRQLPTSVIDALAHRLAGIDLAAPAPGGGQLIVARKPGGIDGDR
ncbi:class I SAM-dependent DNA methyltransferase [Pantanalinema sp. GBBB05]|uniref:class I SAM-dependent DNA methyltransferase n=1 Tax=Pantanalinema sp. GBBB05 TaxID=2604139 RepID=UPI001D4D3DA7|nr:class I SAM-dependent methyltransferase [Pantanalinema sp. GBBB05]